jgi:L-ascorbate metabolism protein UlaG (beta-lactamase superfamily)
MKITKFTHSCVLVEHVEKIVLFDPGIFSWQGGQINVDALPELSHVVVTHKHGDHLAEPFAKALAIRFPEVQWIAPSDTWDDLKSWGITKVTNESVDDIQVSEVEHAPVEPFGVQVKNLIINWDKALTNPGDTHDIIHSQLVLLLPIQAPWGTTVRALQLAQELKPKFVFPIHDWMWNESWRENCYDRFEQQLAQNNIIFLRPKDGVTQSIEV